MSVDRLVHAVQARGGRGAWWAEPDPAAIARADAEVRRHTGQPLPAELAALWSHWNGLVIGNAGPSTPADPLVDAASLYDLLDLTDGELILPADSEALFEYGDGPVPGQLLLGTIGHFDILTVSPDGAVHVIDLDHFDDGPLTLAPTLDGFLDAWCTADLSARSIVQALRDQRPARMKLFPGHHSYVMFRAGDRNPARLLVALTAGTPLVMSLNDVTHPISVVVEIEGESRLEVTDRAPARFVPARTGDHVVRVEGTGPFTIGFTIPVA
jgi:hypothetical protein